jgi:threonylcarbamoyladenosine tRNA methylthiotransferase MtaB
LLANGYREIVLTGIHLGHYGVDWNSNRPKQDWVRLANLLADIVRIDANFRVRLSSIEATEVTRELIDVITDNREKVCPHLHICLQSGSDRILRRMRRRWGTRQFIECCRRIRERLDDPAFTTDVIVGFPGETEEDFAATCQIVREVGFSKVHIFPFSQRRGTPAADMPDQVSGTVKAERVGRLSQLESALRGEYWRRLIGRPLRVLVESPHKQNPGRWIGTSCRYAPVELPAAAESSGQLVNVVPTDVVDNHLVVTA